MKFRSERSRQFLRNQELLDPNADFAEDPVPDDFSVPEVFNTFAAQKDAAQAVATLLKQIQEGRFMVLNFEAVQMVNNNVAYATDGRGRMTAGRPEIRIEMTLGPGPNNDPADDEYPDTPRPRATRSPAGADPPRLLILDDDD